MAVEFIYPTQGGTPEFDYLKAILDELRAISAALAPAAPLPAAAPKQATARLAQVKMED